MELTTSILARCPNECDPLLCVDASYIIPPLNLSKFTWTWASAKFRDRGGKRIVNQGLLDKKVAKLLRCSETEVLKFTLFTLCKVTNSENEQSVVSSIQTLPPRCVEPARKWLQTQQRWVSLPNRYCEEGDCRLAMQPRSMRVNAFRTATRSLRP